MFQKRDHYTLQELLQENYTDLDLYREKPLMFRRGRQFLLVEPVSYGDHPAFLKAMAELVIRYRQIFAEIDFLSSANYNDQSVIKDLTTKVLLFNADKNYRKFMKDVERFIVRWAFFAEEQGNDVRRIKGTRICRRFLADFKADEIIHILFAMFVFNYDIVKKKTLEFFALFADEATSAKRKSSSTSRRKAFRLPKFSEQPFSKSVWRSLEKRSRMH